MIFTTIFTMILIIISPLTTISLWTSVVVNGEIMITISPFFHHFTIHCSSVPTGTTARLFAEPFYRLAHAEADQLPGLVVDRASAAPGAQGGGGWVWMEILMVNMMVIMVNSGYYGGWWWVFDGEMRGWIMVKWWFLMVKWWFSVEIVVDWWWIDGWVMLKWWLRDG